MKSQGDTIAAIATASGRGGVGIVRVSGSLVVEIARHVVGKLPLPRHAEYKQFRGEKDAILDEGLVLYFPSPNSFTGEDVLELQGHGGPVVMDMLLGRVVALGARLARPGEFSERAFFNDKLDLIQAEAIADLIECTSQDAARAAMRSLQGDFSSRIIAIKDALIELRLWVESAIDFPEEEIDFLADSQLHQRLHALVQRLDDLLKTARQGVLLRDGVTIVIAGQPNVGKSSVLNSLAARESAIVTDIPGTTRDLLREHISLDGLPLHIVDTAGLRESEDVVEKIGINRAWDEIRNADRILLVVDDRYNVDEQVIAIRDELPEGVPVTLLRNKIDLTERKPGLSEQAGEAEVAVSAKNGIGIDALREHLKACAGYRNVGEGHFMARRRHMDALSRTYELVKNGVEQLTFHSAGELLAEDLRQAQQALCEITGEFTADDLLGEIFSSFCVGK